MKHQKNCPIVTCGLAILFLFCAGTVSANEIVLPAPFKTDRSISVYSRPDTAADCIMQLEENKRVIVGKFVDGNSVEENAVLECSALQHKWARITFSHNDQEISGFCRAGHLRFPSYSLTLKNESVPVNYPALNGYGKEMAYDCLRDIPEWKLPDSRGTFFDTGDLSNYLFESSCSDGKIIVRLAHLKAVCNKLGVRTRDVGKEKIRFDPPLPCFFISDDTSGTAACSLMQTYSTSFSGGLYHGDSIAELVGLPVKPNMVIIGYPKELNQVKLSVLNEWTKTDRELDRSSICRSFDFDKDGKADLVLFELNGFNQMYELPFRYRQTAICVGGEWYAVSFTHCLNGIIEPSSW